MRMMPFLRRPKRGAHLLLWCLLFALSLPTTCALPLFSHTEGLFVRRVDESNVFVDRPYSFTMGYAEDTDQYNTSHYGFSIPLRDVEPVRDVPGMESTDLSNTVTRQGFDRYTASGTKSSWEIHVVNGPGNMNIPAVMNRCMQIMGEAWESEITVLMKVTFVDLGLSNVLARGGGNYFVRMKDIFGEVVVPVAAAEKIRGRDMNAQLDGDGRYDVLVSINSNSPWYTGVEGNPGESQYDLITVLLHEIYHNIVFAGSITATVEKDESAPGGVRQVATLHKNYLTRYDQFLANENNCAVLGYLNERQLADSLGVSTNELLANACANDNLYFSYYMEDEERIERVVKLYSPRVFKQRSSVYHIDFSAGEAHGIMFPTIKRGYKHHRISAVIIRMQQIIVNTRKKGAYKNCRRPLANPLPRTNATDEDFDNDRDKDKEPDYDSDRPGPGGIYEDDVREVGGLPTWAFALIIVFAILLALLLLGLCLALLLRRRRRRSISISRSRTTTTLPKTIDSRSGTGTGTGTGTDRKSPTQYIGGFSRSKSSSSSSSRSKSKSKSFSRSESESRSKTVTTKKTTTIEEPESSSEKKSVTCPSSGKRVYKCKCYICCPESVTRPPPVASVHEYDPDCAPSGRRSSERSLKKCKTKAEVCHPGCHCYMCCRYKASSSKSSKCKSSTTSCKTSSRCTSTKCSSSKCYCTTTSDCEPSSSRCKTKCKSTTTKCTSRAPPSTKPPTVRPPSTKPPTTKHCKPAGPSTKVCVKSSGRKCGCNSCRRVVEININRC